MAGTPDGVKTGDFSERSFSKWVKHGVILCRLTV